MKEPPCVCVSVIGRAWAGRLSTTTAMTECFLNCASQQSSAAPTAMSNGVTTLATPRHCILFMLSYLSAF